MSNSEAITKITIDDTNLDVENESEITGTTDMIILDTNFYNEQLSFAENVEIVNPETFQISKNNSTQYFFFGQ